MNEKQKLFCSFIITLLLMGVAVQATVVGPDGTYDADYSNATIGNFGGIYLNGVNYTANLISGGWDGTGALFQNGTRPLTADWDAGAFTINAENLSAADYTLDSVGNYTAWIETQIAGISSTPYNTYDSILNNTGGVYWANYMNGTTRSSADFGTLFNRVMRDFDYEGIHGILGGATYSYAVQPIIEGTGSGLEKTIEVVGLGGGPFPILSPTGDNIHGIQLQEGANVHLHKLHFSMKTSGTSGHAIWGPETAGVGAYTENSVWFARFGDLKIEGGTAETWGIYLQLPEWYEFYGRNYLNMGTGAHGIHLESTDTAQFSYGEGQNSGQIYISINGADTIGVWLHGTSSKPLNLLNWRGLLWIKCDTSSANTTAIRATRLYNSFVGGIHYETCSTGIWIESACQNVIWDGYESNNIMLNNSIAFDVDAGYNNKFQGFTLYGAGFNVTWTDDENDDGNSPHAYRDITLWLTGGTFVHDLGASAGVESIGAGGNEYYRLGWGFYP